eukprot:5400469-Pyramimonas_sp.AAC.1
MSRGHWVGFLMEGFLWSGPHCTREVPKGQGLAPPRPGRRRRPEVGGPALWGADFAQTPFGTLQDSSKLKSG